MSGYLGEEVARQAAVRGWRVVGTWFEHEPPSGVAVWLDVRDGTAVDAAFEQIRPDRVVHTAYRQDGPDARGITVDGSANVAAAAARARARLVHVSTDVVFSGRLGRPYRERDRPDPITDYGRLKVAAERAVTERAPGAAVVRTSLMLAGRRPSRHEEVALEAVHGRAPYPFFTDELRCPLAVGDAAAALVELSHLAFAGVLHLAGSDAVSRHELACLVARANGLPADSIPARSGAAEARRPADCRLDSGWARSLLTTRVRGIREVLRPRSH